MISLLCSLQELNFNLIFKSSCKQSIVSAERGGGMATKTAKKNLNFRWVWGLQVIIVGACAFLTSCF